MSNNLIVRLNCYFITLNNNSNMLLSNMTLICAINMTLFVMKQHNYHQHKIHLF